MRHPARRVASALLLLTPLSLTAAAAPSPNAPPSNDERAGATVIDALPYEDHLDVAGATRAADDPLLSGPDCYPEPDRTVWYAFAPEQDVRVAASTLGSDHDTMLAVLVREGEELVTIACNDDTPSTVQSYLHLDLAAGTTYLFQVGASEWAAGSALTFTVVEDGSPLLGGTTTADATAVASPRSGGAVVTGTVHCARDAEVAVDLVILQGRTSAYGWADNLRCEAGATITYSAPTFFLDGGRLRPGSATVVTNTYYRADPAYHVEPGATDVTVVARGRS
jgi:hypothetical protein